MASISTTEVNLKVNPKVSYGLISIAGITLALAQYLLAVGNALSAGEINSGSISLIVTATVTFLGVAAGRYKQASDVINGLSGTAGNPPVAVSEDNEANVLYLDGKEIAAALVKALNTNALIQGMQKPMPAAPEQPGKEEFS